MSKNILVLIALLFGVNAFAVNEVVTQDCLDNMAANSAILKNSAIAVIKGENISKIKRNKLVPVDVQVFNDAHYLLAALSHLAEPQELDARQLIVLAAVCGSNSYDVNTIETILEALPVEE